MTKIKKIIFFVLLSIAFLEKVNATISDSLFMTIGDRAITQSDVINEIKIILILNDESYSAEKREKLQKAAVSSIIKRNMKQIEIDRINYYQFNEQDFRKELVRLASNINVDVDTLKNIFASNDVDFLVIEDQVKVELYWNSLIFELYKSRIKINQNEIEEQLNLIKNEKKIDEFLISEILINLVDEDKLEIEIEKLKNKIKVEGFENVARSISISQSALNEGDLGWLDENVISEEIKSSIVKTPVGKISKAIVLPEGILIFKVRDKRKKQTLSLEERKNQLVNYEKSKILNMYSLTHYEKLRRTITIKFFE